jgi:hypothetical protein
VYYSSIDSRDSFTSTVDHIVGSWRLGGICPVSIDDAFHLMQNEEHLYTYEGVSALSMNEVIACGISIESDIF